MWARLALGTLFLASCQGGLREDTRTLEPPRFRAIAGVSMGAIGATRIGAAHPELFDAIGALGGPLIPEYLLYYLEEHYLGGFCSPDELEAILRAHPGEPDALEDPRNLGCAEAAPARFTAVLPERRQSYDRWFFGQNGGTFDRDAYLDLFEDLVAAFGNPLYDAPGIFPPGLDAATLQDPDLCEAPPVLPPIAHPERNPGGRYPSVAFCDGGSRRPYCVESERAVDRCAEPDVEAACAEEGGVAFATAKTNRALWAAEAAALEPCSVRRRPVSFALAVDVNENGVRDFGEPVVFDSEFGPDAARTRFLAEDPRRTIDAWDRSTRDRMAIYLDGGIRDLFGFGIHASLLFESLAMTDPGARRFEGLADFPGAPASEEELRPLELGADALPRTMLYLYGDPEASQAAIDAGDGDHVGTPRQVLNRLLLFMRWLSLRWEGLEDPPADATSFFSRARSLRFPSPALGGLERDFAVVLPPGYDAPENAEVRYPVVYLLHGYGQRAAGPGGFWESFLLTDGYMASGALRKMILVFPSGRCCQTHPTAGEVRCTEAAEEGFAFECHSGSFYTPSVASGRDHAGAVLDLVRHVDASFRTLSAPAPMP